MPWDREDGVHVQRTDQLTIGEGRAEHGKLAAYAKNRGFRLPAADDPCVVDTSLALGLVSTCQAAANGVDQCTLAFVDHLGRQVVVGGTDAEFGKSLDECLGHAGLRMAQSKLY
jgi:hypothetical protein